MLQNKPSSTLETLLSYRTCYVFLKQKKHC